MKTVFSQFAVFVALLLAATPFNTHAFVTKADYAVLLDSETSTTLFEKNADQLMMPSSMTKLMTTYIVFERLSKNIISLDDTFVVSKKAWKKGGSKTFLRHTERVSVRDLLHGVIVQSGNDACIVLAEAISTSEEEFAKLMTKTGKRIGLTNSTFKNATGWPDEGHQMTARDIAILSQRLIQDFPQYYHMFSLEEFTYSGITQRNRNSLLGLDIGVDGLKTGHTEKAGYGIAVSSKRNGQRLIAVVNGLRNTSERAIEAERLLQHGYRSFAKTVLYKAGEPIEHAQTWLAAEESLPLVAEEDITLILPKLPDGKIDIAINYIGPIPAPIRQGTLVAKLQITLPGMKDKTFPLYAGKDISKAGWLSQAITIIKHYAKDGV